jgi:hypothetical protein
MSTFEDHLWSQLVSDHNEQMRQAGKATASLAASLRESNARGRWRTSSGRRSRRQLALAATTLVVACASAIIVAHTATRNPTYPPISRAAFALTDNHDGTLTVTLDKRSALPALNASLARYGLKAKLPGEDSARTLSLVATCPKAPTLPVRDHPLRLIPAGPQRAPFPGTPHRLKYCVLHTT